MYLFDKRGLFHDRDKDGEEGAKDGAEQTCSVTKEMICLGNDLEKREGNKEVAGENKMTKDKFCSNKNKNA